jgi:hypothetical protein
MPKKTLSKSMKKRRCAELARLGNASGVKACVGVANTGRPRVGTIMNLAPVPADLAEEAFLSVAIQRSAKREKCRCSPRLSEYTM